MITLFFKDCFINEKYISLEENGVIKIFCYNCKNYKKFMSLDKYLIHIIENTIFFEDKDLNEYTIKVDYIISCDEYIYHVYNNNYDNFSIVVSRYKEDLNWLKNHYSKCIIYDKGCNNNYNTKIWRYENVENVGRESHTYLKYIIDNYDSLPNIIIFTQGNIKDHNINISELMEFKEKAKKYGMGYDTKKGENEILVSKQIIHVGKWLDEREKGIMRKANINFDDFYKEVIGTDAPNKIKWIPSAIFAVRKDLIIKNDKAFYQKIIKYVDDHINPEEGHYFERIWFSLFQN